MAEVICIVQNIAGVISAGLSLSKTLYDFASTLGSASEDVKSLATDISLFCSVLKQVQATLTQARAFRLSLSAVQTAQDVVDRCQIIFDELEATVKKLQRGDSQLDFLTRVKWFFKEKRILLIHEQLKTCGATLHLMLTTLILAQKIASKRLSLVDANYEDDEDAQDRLMTHSLFMAQQAATERLAAIEDELLNERQKPDSNDSSPQDSLSVPGLDGASIKHRRNRSSRIINGFVHSPDRSADEQAKRVSAVVGRHINRLSLIDNVRKSQSSAVEEHRLSILQTDELLRQWTDQSDPLAAVDEEEQFGVSDTLNERPDSRSSMDSSWVAMDTDELRASGLDLKVQSEQFGVVSSRQGDDVQTVDAELTAEEATLEAETPRATMTLPPRSFDNSEANAIQDIKSLLEKVELTFQRILNQSPQSAKDESQAPPQHCESENIDTIKNLLQKVESEHQRRVETLQKKDPADKQDPPHEVFRSLRVTYDEPCHSVLRLALQKYGIDGDHTHWSLMLCDGPEQRKIEFDEKPLGLFKIMEQQGKKPRFMLRRRPQPIPWSKPDDNIDGKKPVFTLRKGPPPVQWPPPPDSNVQWPPPDADFGPPLPLNLFTATSAILQVQGKESSLVPIQSPVIAPSA